MISFSVGGWLEIPTAAHFLKNNDMATIIGKNSQKEEKSSWLLQVRYTAADSKFVLLGFFAENPLLQKTPLNKKQLKEIFLRNLFTNLQRKSLEPLAEFLFQQALKHGYIEIVPKIRVDDEQEYIVSPTIVENRPGPKRLINN